MLSWLSSFLFAASLPALFDASVTCASWAVFLAACYFVWRVFVAPWVLREIRDVPKVKSVPLPKIKGGKFRPFGQGASAGDNPMGEKEITQFCPASLQILGEVPVDNAAAVAERASRAREAQAEWQKTDWPERRRVLRTIRRYILEHKDDLVRASCLDTSKTEREAMLGEVMVTLNRIEYAINCSEKYLSNESRSVNALAAHKTAYVEYVPFGLIGCIVPSNFPIQNSLSHAIDALVSGNACIIKLSEWGCWCSPYLEKILRSCLEACGHSPDLIHFVNGYAETGCAIIDECDKVLFIGSTGVGKAVQAHAAKTWTPVTLELGGKDAFVLLDDANLDISLVMGTSAAFFNCGQNCVAAERYIIHESLYDKFRAGVLETYDKLRQGDDLCGAGRCDSGAVLVPAWFDRYDDFVQDAVAKGAKVLRGGKRGEGMFYELTVLEHCTLDMKVTRDETFGPFLCLMEPFKDDEQAIDMINSAPFGLGLTVYGSKPRCLKVVAATRTGMAAINDFGLNMMIQSLPFGGVGESGHGRFWGIEGMRDFTYPRAVSHGWVAPPPPFMTVPTSKNAPRSVAYLLDIVFHYSLVSRAVACFKLVRDLILKDY